jgi:hypothetical protein
MANNAGSWELFGVTSFGKGCEERGLPGVYARAKRKCPIQASNWGKMQNQLISAMRLWILDTIGSDCPRG